MNRDQERQATCSGGHSSPWFCLSPPLTRAGAHQATRGSERGAPGASEYPGHAKHGHTLVQVKCYWDTAHPPAYASSMAASLLQQLSSILVTDTMRLKSLSYLQKTELAPVP